MQKKYWNRPRFGKVTSNIR